MITLNVTETICRTLNSYTVEGEVEFGEFSVEPMELWDTTCIGCKNGSEERGLAQFAILVELLFTNPAEVVSKFADDGELEYDEQLSIYSNIQRQFDHRVPLQVALFKKGEKVFAGFYTHVVGQSCERKTDKQEIERIIADKELLSEEIERQGANHYVNRFVKSAVFDSLIRLNYHINWLIERRYTDKGERAEIDKTLDSVFDGINSAEPSLSKRELELLATMREAEAELSDIRNKRAASAEKVFWDKPIINGVPFDNLCEKHRGLVERRTAFLFEDAKSTPEIK
ncbi:hypothetical protein [Vibrio crassostreae]|uniref:hypothetical protein n=1 Tax=Vibrio crassostreae TaxID=246167 RepID=UPI001B30C73E|nr:hypothetical protein [Vibrio crassostreae]